MDATTNRLCMQEGAMLYGSLILSQAFSNVTQTTIKGARVNRNITLNPVRQGNYSVKPLGNILSRIIVALGFSRFWES